MFNLFGNKNGNSTVAVKTTTYPKVVNEIHNEFFTAGENILEEATFLLKELETKDLAKGKRLAALGFGKTREAVVAIETENKLATTKEIADLVMYYRINYPNNKFITEEQVKSICEKYGLVCGKTTMYKGFVPENKLSIIESFKVKEKDNVIAEIVNDGVVLNIITDYKIFNTEWTRKRAESRISFYISSDQEFRKGIKNYEQYPPFAYIEFPEPSLKICAPLKDMEIPKGKEVKGYKIQDIPDPVVLQPVNGGYLIVCAWGDEATDEIVVNQANN